MRHLFSRNDIDRLKLIRNLIREKDWIFLVSEKGSVCKNENCRDCEVYHSLEEHAGIKHLLRELL